jgi:hypothetical protein
MSTKETLPGTPIPWGIERTPTTNWIGPLRKDSHKIDQVVVCTDREGLRLEAVLRNDADADYIVEACNNYTSLRTRLDAAEKELAAISAAVDREYNGPNDKRSDDLLDDIGAFIDHHKAKETELEKTKQERDNFHQCLLNREKSLKRSGDDWVKAKEETDRVKLELAQLKEENATIKKELALAVEQVSITSTELTEATEANAELVKDKERLEGLLNLTNNEGVAGWRVTLSYDNYQDGALVINANGKVISECYDIDLSMSSTIVRLNAEVKTLKAQNERLEKALQQESKRLDWVMQHPMIFHHKIFMEKCGGYEGDENEQFRAAIDLRLAQEAKAVLEGANVSAPQ